MSALADSLGPLAHYVSEEQEHAVEIQLPFLQRCLGPFQLVPVLLERQSLECAERVATALLAAIGGDPVTRTLVIASSDLSHDRDAAAAGGLDREFLRHVEGLDADGLMTAVGAKEAEACGAGAVAATLLAARNLGAAAAQVLHYGTSGDVTGRHERVVGYASAAMYAVRAT